jgi:hypothetical protein
MRIFIKIKINKTFWGNSVGGAPGGGNINKMLSHSGKKLKASCRLFVFIILLLSNDYAIVISLLNNIRADLSLLEYRHFCRT